MSLSRTLKILSILAGVLTLSAVMASAASAQGTYTCSAYPCAITGTSPAGNETFITKVGAVECSAHFQAVLNAPSSHLQVKPTYPDPPETHCKFPPFSATVHMNGCEYTFETPAKVAVDHYAAPMQIVCPAGQSIRITIPATTPNPVCEIQIHSQTPGGSVTLTNDTAVGDVTVKANVTGITYTVTRDAIGCPFPGTGTTHNGSYVQHNPVTFDSAVNFQVSG